MFKKLVSNIPFNPSLIEQIPDYQRDLKKELNLRFLGLGILVLALLGQLFISVYPAQPTLASSPNDLINGGFNTQAQLINDCDNNTQGYRNILSYYSISCGALSTMTPASIRSTNYNKQLFSLNRLAYGQSPETTVNINQQNYFLRPFWKGNSLSSKSVVALQGVNAKGASVFIAYNSGDLVFIGQPSASSTCTTNFGQSCLELSITARDSQSDNSNGTTAKPGNVIVYTLLADNKSKNTINDFVVGTNLSSALTYSKIINLYGGSLSNNYVSWPKVNIPANQTVTRSFSSVVKKPVAQTPLSATDPNYYNLKMSTSYGNTVVIKLPWSFSKYFELKINNGLTSLSASLSLLISILLVTFISYFSYRTRLLLRELKYVKEDYINGGRD